MSETLTGSPTTEVLPPEMSENEESTESNEEGVEASEEGEKKPDTIDQVKAQEKKIEQAKEILKKKLKIKVDGVESEEEIDLNDDEALRKHIQFSKAAQKRMAESAALKKDVEVFLKSLQEDPKNVLKELGIDPKKFAETVINEEIEELQKSPEQREKEKMQKELEALRKDVEKKEAERKEREFQQMQEKYALELDRDITKALGDSSKLPKSPYVVKRIADAMMLAIENGYQDVAVGDVLPLVEKQINEEIQGMFGAMPEEVMEQLIGKGNLDRLRKNRLKKVKAPIETATKVKDTGAASTKKSEQTEAQKIAAKDFFKNLGRR